MSGVKPAVIGLSLSMPALAIVSVILRYQARLVKRSRFGADDYAILVALILAIGLALSTLLGKRFNLNAFLSLNVLLMFLAGSKLGNLGGHQRQTAEGLPIIGEEYKHFTKANYAAQLLWFPCVGVTKISVLLLYKRIFFGKKFRILVWTFIAFLCVWMISFWLAHLCNNLIVGFEDENMLILSVGCLPISAIWNLTIMPTATCVDRKVLYTIGCSTDILTDVLILILPVYNVWKLQMKTSRKLCVIGVFLLGSLVTIAGAIRLMYVIEAFNGLASYRNTDISYTFAFPIMWTTVETSLGVVSACLPTLAPLYTAYSFGSLVKRIRSKITLPSALPLKYTHDLTLLPVTDTSSKKSNNNT